jgi:fumarate hydratase class II
MSDHMLYGEQTRKALANFPISGRPLDVRVIYALAWVKVASARTNASMGVLDADVAVAIETAAREVAEGRHDDQFGIDTFQTGSGTSSNMNVNEVIASLAATALGNEVHPNDDVNASQSSNDVFPTAVHVATARTVMADVLPALHHLADTLDQHAEPYHSAVKPGRTHLMDAVPVTLGQELAGYAMQVRKGAQRVERCLESVCEVPLGGTAVGTGLNTPAGYRDRVVAELASLTALPLSPAADGLEAQSARDGLVELSGALRGVAVSLTKICNDLRWMASGPRTGLAEITLPALQAGSSIMPGKVNPVIPEATLQVCSRVIGNDATIAWAGASGSFELNVQMPVMADAILESSTLLANASRLLADRCIAGITANDERMRELAQRSPAIVTALNAAIGYEAGKEVVARAAHEGIDVIDALRSMTAAGELPVEALDALDLTKLARPHG